VNDDGVSLGCITANAYQKISTTAGLSSIASLSLLVSMSMTGLGGRPLLARCTTGSSGTALSSLMPPYRYRRSSGSSGSRSLQGPASAVLERRRLSTTPPPRQQPSPTVTTTIHETITSPLEPADDSSVDLLVDMTDCQQTATASSTLLIPDIPQSRSDNVLSVSDRAIKSFNHATSNGFLHTT